MEKIMHFRTRGSRVELIRTTYDPTKKRGVHKSLGTMSAHYPMASELERERFGDEEWQEVEQWVAKWHADFAAAQQARAVQGLPASIDAAITAIETGVAFPPSLAEAIREALGRLDGTCKRLGLTRVLRAPVTPQAAPSPARMTPAGGAVSPKLAKASTGIGGARTPTDPAIIARIRELHASHGWGKRRIAEALVAEGINVTESTVTKYLRSGGDHGTV